MTRHLLHLAAFLLGLAVVGWIGAGYAGTNLLAFAVTLLIGACYLAGAFELHRYRRAIEGLTRALAGLSSPPPDLGAWLDGVPARLRHAVRLRIEGDHVALPGPALAPHLVGLLVLLGMLGTFLGMVATLRGTGIALEGVTDLESIRAALAAPVKGLGFAFGTSVAGVATSAMLGLLSALCRREAIHAAQLLDGRIATMLRGYSRVHQREEAFKLLQRQAELMPAVVDRMQAMMTAMEQHSQTLAQRLAASQDAFHGKTEIAYTQLAQSVEQTLQESIAASARAAGAAIQPAVEATLAGLTRETATWHDAVTQAVERQLDGMSSRLEASTGTVAQRWQDALTDQRRANSALNDDLRASLAAFTDAMEQRCAALVDNIAARMETAASRTTEAWDTALARHERVGTTLAEDNRQALSAAAADFAGHAAALVDMVSKSQAELQAQLGARDQHRLDAWTGKLDRMAESLHRQWQQTTADTARSQQQICQTLAGTARDLAAQTEAQTRNMIAEVARLVDAATEAPKAAATVIGELRQKLSDGMARDNAMLEERGRLLETLGTLLDAVTHASTEQRAAVDTLVATTADLLDRVGNRFTDQVQAEAGRLSSIAAQVTGSAVEVASLGEAFGAAVQSFSESNDKLVGHLARIESALDKSMTRSDEQLAYYVAQAREVVDLSILSQKQILEALQQAAPRLPSAEAA